MIIGVGTDIVELKRIEKLLSGKIAEKFIHRILTEEEGERLLSMSENRKKEHIAGRYAAKEAIVKALGCGIGEKVGFHDIIMMPNADGKPEVRLSQKAFDKLNLSSEHITIHLSISHSTEQAVAFAVAEQQTEI
ncbi:holo-ACP synthase [Longirhabdus pacifica]|uniref:holo-ACP synthase n=1 Tax=Longirhabdus pacifica TaxID=2305227 RepID=UPI001008A38C|nr:holo-ACP synthase [Longirhabdus pacifica]